MAVASGAEDDGCAFAAAAASSSGDVFLPADGLATPSKPLADEVLVLVWAVATAPVLFAAAATWLVPLASGDGPGLPLGAVVPTVLPLADGDVPAGVVCPFEAPTVDGALPAVGADGTPGIVEPVAAVAVADALALFAAAPRGCWGPPPVGESSALC